MHGQSILQMLMEAVSAADQENKRRPTRAGSVPPRATTPVNSSGHNLSSSTRTGAVTPAVRPRSAMSSLSVPSKRRKLNDSSSASTSGHAAGRAPLSNHRNNYMPNRPASPSRAKTKTPGSVTSSALKSNHTIPRTVTRFQTLGHGRRPNAQIHSSGMRSVSAEVKGSSSSTTYGRLKPSSKSMAGPESSVLRKASRAKRESFMPRPSTDGAEMGKSVGIGSSRWGGGKFASSVKEEGEGY